MQAVCGPSCDLLIVDDDFDQVRLFEISLEELGLQHRCHSARNATAALAFLRNHKPFEHAPRPKLIIVDINMPGMNGCELLHEIKTDKTLADIPVVMLSSSIARETVRECYREHANAYLKKPLDYTSVVEMVASIESFWVQQVVSCP